jgi:hypothetical protein
MSWRFRASAAQARLEAADKARELYHLLSSSHSMPAARPLLHPDDYVAAYATGYEHERIQAELASRYSRPASPIRSSVADDYDSRESERSVLSLLSVAREREEALHVYARTRDSPKPNVPVHSFHLFFSVTRVLRIGTGGGWSSYRPTTASSRQDWRQRFADATRKQRHEHGRTTSSARSSSNWLAAHRPAVSDIFEVWWVISVGLFHPLLVQLLEAADLRLSERAREFEAALSAERADARDRASDAALASDTRCPACSGVTAAAWHRSMLSCCTSFAPWYHRALRASVRRSLSRNQSRRSSVTTRGSNK